MRYQHQHASLPVEQLKDVPQPVVALLEVLLEKNPGVRLQTPNELLQAIAMVTSAMQTRRAIKHEKLRTKFVTHLNVDKEIYR